MRILLAIHNVYSDNTSGAARCVRGLMEWLCAAGHECAVLSTTRFDNAPPTRFHRHLKSIGVTPRRHPVPKGFQRYLRMQRREAKGKPLLSYKLNGVPVTVLLTEHNDATRPDRAEYEQFIFHVDDALLRLKPDLVIAYGAHGVLQEAMRHARGRGTATLFWLHNHGYEDREIFRYADHVLSPSDYLRRHYEGAIGQPSAVLPPVINYREIMAADGARNHLTFVKPTAAKGAVFFTGLAAMLAGMRPDIPILVIQSAADDSLLRGAAGPDLTQFASIHIDPPVAESRLFLARTRVLLVPSVFQEPFGTIAAEAMLNGIPPVVSNRGGLPDTVRDAGIVLPLPDWLDEASRRTPEQSELKPWFDAVCRLWDDAEAYSAAGRRAVELGLQLYAEDSLRRRYLDYIEALCPSP